MERALIISRDISIILLVIEWLVLGAIPFLVLLKITQGLRRLLPQVRPALHRFHDLLRRGLGYVERFVLGLRKPFDWAVTARVRIAHVIKRFPRVS